MRPAAATPLLFVAGDPDGPEERAALAWLARRVEYAVTAAGAATLDADAVAAATLVWVHAAERAPQLPPAAERALTELAARGGAVVLTLFGTALVVPLGLETSPPNRAAVSVWHEDATEHRTGGVLAWGQHPLVEGLGRGAVTWAGSEGERVGECVYVRPRWPGGGRVALVERYDDAVDADVAVAWDYGHTGRRVVCVGAHLHFAAGAGEGSAARDALALNALRMAAREAPARATAWPVAAAGTAALDAARFAARPLGPVLPEVASAITLSGAAGADAPFTLAGRRAFVVGSERGGVDEIWAHPVCVVAGGLELRVDGELPEVRSVDVSPEQVVRHLTTRTRFVEERVFVPVDEGAVAVEYRYRRLGRGRADVAAPRLELRLRLPLRLDAPLAADLLHPLRVARTTDHEVTTLAVVGRDEHYAALVSVEGAATVTVLAEDREVRVGITASLTERVRVTFAGSALGRAGLDRTITAIARRGWRGLALRRAERAAALQHDHLALRSPSASLDTALEWAKARLVSAVATVPGVGSGAVAGYGATAPAAWFGAAAAGETGRGLLACGLFAEARAVLESLAAHAGPDGAPPDATTAGVTYATAEGAPAFVELVAAFDAWTGDAAEVRRVWPTVTRVLSAAPADATGAAAWRRAAAALAPIAERLGDAGAAARCRALVRQGEPAAEAAESDAFRRALDLALGCYEGARGAFAGPAALGARQVALPDASAAAARLALAVVHDLLGADPDASARRVRLAPRWPREWAHATLHHLRVGDATLELEAVEGCLVDGVPHDGVTYRVRSVPAGALTVTLEHPIDGRTFGRVRADGAEAEVERCGSVDRPRVRVTRWLASPLELQFVGDAIG